MTPERCTNCHEIKRLEFQIAGDELIIKDVNQTQQNKDIEHEQMIQNLTNRMDTVSQDLQTFKEEVREDIQNIKKDIPAMFDNAVNKLLAKMFRIVAIGVFIIVCVIILAFSRPVILKGIDEVRHWVETVEVQK